MKRKKQNEPFSYLKVSRSKKPRHITLVCDKCGYELLGVNTYRYWCNCNPSAPYEMYDKATRALVGKVIDAMTKQAEIDRIRRAKYGDKLT